MSSVIPITTDTLLNNIPKLDVKGMSWTIFVFWFLFAVKAKELWGHFDGTATHPPVANPQAPTNEETTAINHLATVCNMWKEIKTEYTEKGAYLQTDLHA
ncbi:hypothetical protein OG21DRAFT_1487670 [Imleria badia]|nr:hypothetical protein OG21DRAFT_1487670 [Imleria badia]